MLCANNIPICLYVLVFVIRSVHRPTQVRWDIQAMCITAIIQPYFVWFLYTNTVYVYLFYMSGALIYKACILYNVISWNLSTFVCGQFCMSFSHAVFHRMICDDFSIIYSTSLNKTVRKFVNVSKFTQNA